METFPGSVQRESGPRFDLRQLLTLLCCNPGAFWCGQSLSGLACQIRALSVSLSQTGGKRFSAQTLPVRALGEKIPAVLSWDLTSRSGYSS